MFDLSGNIALITGASGGIGAAIARALHVRGATVVLHGTRAERLAELRRAHDLAELGLGPLRLGQVLEQARDEV